MIVYLAHNKINAKNYVGQTKQRLHTRIANHYSYAKKANHNFGNALNIGSAENTQKKQRGK